MLLNFLYNNFQIQHPKELPKAKTVIVGDSRMMTGVNPSLIDSSINYSHNSESYFISYYKLKYILKQSNGIKNIIIGFSYPSFSAYLDKIFNNDVATADVLNRVYSIIPLKDFRSIPVNNEKYRITYFRNTFVYPVTNQTPFLGSYNSLPKTSKNINYKSIIQRHYYTSDGTNVGVSEINRMYLDSIQLLTKNNNISLYLVELPLYGGYYNEIPTNFKSFFNEIKTKIKKKENVKIIDFGNDNCPNTFFKDAVHLSSEGADYYSKKINTIINHTHP